MKELKKEDDKIKHGALGAVSLDLLSEMIEERLNQGWKKDGEVFTRGRGEGKYYVQPIIRLIED